MALIISIFHFIEHIVIDTLENIAIDIFIARKVTTIVIITYVFIIFKQTSKINLIHFSIN